jgi:hypothetical protein
MLKQELTGHRYSLSDRLRLFNGTVTPTVLYSSETWVMTAELENRLRKTQRQMLRMILHAPRRKNDNNNETDEHAQQSTQPQPPRMQPVHAPPHAPTDDYDDNDDNDDNGSDVDSNPPTPEQQQQYDDDNDEASDLEPWVDWIRRCTHDAEARMKKLQLDDWVTMQRRRKWRWAHKMATTTQDTWTTIALQWDPTLDRQLDARRRTGRPKTRWTDDISDHVQRCEIMTARRDDHNGNNVTTPDRMGNQVYDTTWLLVARDKQKWADLERAYVMRQI